MEPAPTSEPTESPAEEKSALEIQSPAQTTDSQSSEMLPASTERMAMLTRRLSGDEDGGFNSIEMKIMNMRTGRQHEVDFFIDPVEFLSVKTVENFHTYLWVLKDLSWTQNWYWTGLIVGSLAMGLSFIVTVGSLHSKEYANAWHNFAQLLWLMSNFIWMTGDFHDTRFPNSPSVYDERSVVSQYIMMFALAWLGVYYLLLRPFNLFDERDAPYCRITEKSWISRHIFRNWRYATKYCMINFYVLFMVDRFREYERLHIFFWLLKDFGWNILSEPIWFLGLIPTLTMSIDFAWIVANVNVS